MRADKVEVSWEDSKHKWLVRIVSGEEVIRRFCDLPKSADEQSVLTSALKTVRDEGYEIDTAAVTLAGQTRTTQA